MYRWFLILMVALMCCQTGNKAAALPEVIVTPGVKIWQNDWIYNGEGGWKFQDSSFLAGPSVKLTMGKAFAGATYMRSVTDYELTWQDYRVSTPRTDIDIVFGYLFHQNVSLFAGYKNVLYDPDSYKEQDWYSSSVAHIDAGIVGIGVFKTVNKNGLTLNASIAGGVYDATSYMNSVVELDSESESELILLRFGDKGEIYSGEVGAAFPISEGTYFSFGYKYQTFKNDSDTSMIFKGLVFSIDFVF
jgi:predicted porin